MFRRTLFSDEHEIFRNSVRKFVAEHVTPYHDQWERDGQVSRESWLAAGKHGILCPALPEELGGAGADFLFSAIIIEEFSRVGASGPGFYLHSDIVVPYLVNYGSAEQQQCWLPKMITGERIGAIAMTEPSAGSDLQSIRTTARREGDQFVINGQKVFITNGQLADVVIVACKTDASAGAKGISLIVVEREHDGFRRGRNLEKIGYKAQDTSELFFEDVRVPVGNLLGGEGRGFVCLMEQLPQERLIQAIRCIATIEGALEWTTAYVEERQAFGRPLSAFQNTRFVVADVKAQATMLRVFVDRCIEMHLAGELDAVDAAISKLLSSEMMGDLLDRCLQMFGGYGYMWEYPIARVWADARMARIAGGTCEIMREIIGRSMFGNKERGR